MNTKTYENFSILLTKISLIALFIGAVILLCTGTWVVDLVVVYPSPFLQGTQRFMTMLILGYGIGFLSLIFIYHIYQLVSRFAKNLIFTAQNVRSLQLLGWEAAAITLLSLIIGVTCYIPVLLITAAGIALTLVIRVIRNAFGKAVELQDEVDFTI
ncbi:DUF2975 domain-containing protein [Streptococcus parauberis]|uniref:DUF2975 domain-containing protein n=1 Tax=Streptococcus parauberis NCFD 2020 TaxID=873447 RepID=F1YZZ5_9STRE|nr:DUF2975 domain-containing protein [Streptococcus parauberis]EGE53525.1 hypothetical protein SPB_1797 [Streptococcus parauberis NCFD 2020]PNY18433.1 hypothetical protein ASN86_02004 [Streptococcus parauberis]RFE01463.1 hypothetical protein ADO06_01376 [Streptococcus parauberis]